MNNIKITALLIFLSTLSVSGQVNSNDSIKSKEETFFVVEKVAQFPGGMEELYRFINKNLKYPKDARRQRIEGKLFIEFAINSDGSIDDNTIVVIKGLNESCDNEAIRVMKECPDWIPATIKNKAVKQRFTMPITFKL